MGRYHIVANPKNVQTGSVINLCYYPDSKPDREKQSRVSRRLAISFEYVVAEGNDLTVRISFSSKPRAEHLTRFLF